MRLVEVFLPDTDEITRSPGTAQMENLKSPQVQAKLKFATREQETDLVKDLVFPGLVCLILEMDTMLAGIVLCSEYGEEKK
jgi:hypothetical protein